MNREEDEFHKTKWRRIRRVKRWLRPLPRRATLHRYPILKFFAEAARKRVYIWSFRVENAVPAIYSGSILALMPLFGIQLPLSLLLALVLRANLPILAGLQFIANPITIFPIWFSGYQVGRQFLGMLSIEAAPLSRSEVYTLLFNFSHGEWGEKFDRFATVFGITCLGGAIMGSFLGLIGSLCYRIVANRTKSSYEALRDKIHHSKIKNQPPHDEAKHLPD